jgi:hypothetical protein
VAQRNCLPEQERLEPHIHVGAKPELKDLQNGNFSNKTRYVAMRTDESFSHE